MGRLQGGHSGRFCRPALPAHRRAQRVAGCGLAAGDLPSHLHEGLVWQLAHSSWVRAAMFGVGRLVFFLAQPHVEKKNTEHGLNFHKLSSRVSLSLCLSLCLFPSEDASKHVAGALFLLLREQLGRLRLQGRLVEAPLRGVSARLEMGRG